MAVAMQYATATEKLNLLGRLIDNDSVYNGVVDKLLALVRSRFVRELDYVNREIVSFEQRYGKNSLAFIREFDNGSYDDADSFEWCALLDLRRKLDDKIKALG
ncbi:MAG: hypothetical protein WCP79_00795 [Bacillota bacterium]